MLIVGRSAERGAQVLAELHDAQPDADHRFFQADLSLLAETAWVADEVAGITERLDAVVCCAGILFTVPEWTAEGLERNFVLNYLTRYLLARRLLPTLALAPSGRLVLVSNAGKYGDTLNFDDLQHRSGKPGLKVAGRTQFANDLLATELSSRLRGTRVEVTCVYPGLVRTGVFRNARGLPLLARGIAPVILSLLGQLPETAARTPVYLAQDPQARGTGGQFYGPGLRQQSIPFRALRPERRAQLWTASEALVRPYLTIRQRSLHPSPG